MKIRDTFVSNSSSSSFILKAQGQTSSVREVAKLMINTMIESFLDDGGYYDSVDIRVIDDVEEFLKEKNEWLERRELYLKEKTGWMNILDEKDENQPIFFPSCNYDTWIARAADNILVCTCNNEPWSLPNRVFLSKEAEKELLKIAGDDEKKKSRVERIIEDPYDFYGVYGLFDNFYALSYKITGTEHPEADCTKHKYQSMWKTNMGIVCPICVSERRDKLEQIEKITGE